MNIERILQQTVYLANPNVTAFDIAMDNTAASNQPLYIGFAPSGSASSAAVWVIFELAYDGNNNVSRVAWGNGGASNLVWNNRATGGYTYVTA